MAVMRLGDGRWCCRCGVSGGGGGRKRGGGSERKEGRSVQGRERVVCLRRRRLLLSVPLCSRFSRVDCLFQEYAWSLGGEGPHARRSISISRARRELFAKGRAQRERKREGGGERECCFALDWFFNRTIESTQHCPSNTHRAFFMASKPPPRATAASSACWVSTATTKALPLLPPRRLLLLR